MLRLSNIKMNLNHNFDDVLKYIKNYLKTNNIFNITISSKSIDARNKNNIYIVYSIDFDTNNIEIYNNIEKYKNLIEVIPYKYDEKKIVNYKGKRPVIIGSGPAGLFAAIILSRAGLKPIIIERGKAVEDREKDVYEFFNKGILNTNSNVQFGEGGAGTFSDGKLTTNTHNIRIKKVIEELIKAGADEKISYISKPHIGTDELIKIVANIRKDLENLGATYLFSTKYVSFKEKNNKLKSILVEDLLNNDIYEIETDYMILAIGHSARDTFESLFNQNINMIKKTFSVGVRIEHKQEYINKIQYGENYKLLPPAEYKINAKSKDGRGIYSFCMCPGGMVVAASSEENKLVVNGMSYSKRDMENANSAILVNINPEDLEEEILSGIKFQRMLEEKAFILGGSNYKAPVQLVKDYINNTKSKKIGMVKPSYPIGYTLSNINDIFPEYINNSLREGFKLLNNKIKGFIENDSIITGVESRSSSPIRIIRNDKYYTNILGIIPSGEGAGYAGGIMSAAVDGIKCAEIIIDEIINKM